MKEAAASLDALRHYCCVRRLCLSSDSFTVLCAIKSCTRLQLPWRINTLRHLHAHILKIGFHRHVYVATSLLSAYAFAFFKDARVLFDEMPARNTVTWNVMITGYAREGDIGAARNVFDDMPQRNIASWSAMISAYVDRGLWRQGVALFRQMLIRGRAEDVCLKPDKFTMGPILASCSRMGLIGLVFGKSVHAFSVRNCWELDVEFGTGLVAMYAKCGNLRMASSIFHMMRSTNVATWTALICGAAQHGFGKEALRIFEKMIGDGVRPNELTFTGILTACVQVKLVDEGRKYFKMMLQQYGLMPGVQHYGCMVDLFGKTGLLTEALEVINTMPFQPNVVIWGSFLSSCKLHRHFQMAEKVIDDVMKVVRPENDGGLYSLVSDLYILGGRRSEAEQLRELMLTQNVRKARGYSFI